MSKSTRIGCDGAVMKPRPMYPFGRNRNIEAICDISRDVAIRLERKLAAAFAREQRLKRRRADGIRDQLDGVKRAS